MKKLCSLLLLLYICNSAFAQGSSFAWAKRMGATGFDVGYSIVTDNNNDVISTGVFTGTVDFDPNAGTTNLLSNGTTDIYIQKLDSNGNLIWAESVGGLGGDYSTTVVVDNSNNIYVTGYFAWTVDFDPGVGVSNLTSLGGNDIFVLKLTSTGSFVWAKSFGGTGADGANSIAVDNAMNVYTTGTFTNTVDFDPGAGISNLLTGGFFIQKLDASGNFVWAKQLQGTTISATSGKTVQLDSNGNPVILGLFQSTIDFDSGVGVANLISNGGNDIFILKLGTGGNFVWAKSFGGINSDAESFLAIDNSGNIFTTGHSSGTIDFDPGVGVVNLTLTSSNFIQKLDVNGNFVWAKQFGSGWNYTTGLDTDINGNVYTTGYYDTNTDFDPGAGIFTLTGGGYIQKLDSLGNFVWAKSIGTPKQIYPQSIALDNTGAIYTTGAFSTSFDFDPGSGIFNLSSSGGNDAFILKLADCGGISYGTQNFTGCGFTANGIYYTTNGTYVTDIPSFSGCDSIVTTSYTHATFPATSNNINITSCHRDTINNVVYSSTGTYTQHLYNFHGCDSALTIHFTYVPSATSSINVISCHADIINNVVYGTTGTYTQFLSSSVYGCDSVLTIHFTLYTSSASISIVACNNYTLNGQTYNVNGNYIQTLAGASLHGCDSVLTIHLFIVNSSTGNLFQTVCDSLVYNSTTYTTSGIYTQHIPNSNGCDSTLTIHLTVLNSIRDTINVSSCNSYVLNGYIYTSSGTYNQSFTSSAGCDSTLIINLAITQNISSNLYHSACNNYTFNGITYFTSGTHTQHFTSASGCDSAVTLHLTIHPGTSYTLVQTACNSYTFNASTYFTSGSYVQHLSNSFGCDSTLTINLTVYNVNPNVTQAGGTLTADLANAAYQWLNCDSSFTLLPGIVTQAYTPTSNGNYAVMITSNACVDTSSCFTIFSVGINENENENSILIYPNPVTNELGITNYGLGIIEVRIYNILGKVVFQSTISHQLSISNVDVSGLANAIYLVEVKTEKGMKRKKFIKE